MKERDSVTIIKFFYVMLQYSIQTKLQYVVYNEI